MYRTLKYLLAVLFALSLIFALAHQSHAQEWTIQRDDDWCDDGGARYCEVREITLRADREIIRVDGGSNGGIRVFGWDRDEIVLRAKVRIHDGDRSDARELASKIDIETGRTIRADGPKSWRGKSWSVTFELHVPVESHLSLETTNGGIRIANVKGDVDFDATNGGVHLSGVAGDVRGHTTNGGLEIELEGKEWVGAGLDVRTTNGGVHLYIPDGYSADLETGTVNGRVHLDFPVLVEGTIGKKIKTRLGDGGKRIRATTTNGGVHIKKS